MFRLRYALDDDVVVVLINTSSYYSKAPPVLELTGRHFRVGEISRVTETDAMLLRLLVSAAAVAVIPSLSWASSDVARNRNNCSLGPTHRGVSFEGNNVQHSPLSTAPECAAACCNTTRCSAYTHTSHYPWPVSSGSQNCTTGAPCCFLKSSVGKSEPLDNCTSGVVSHGSLPPPPPPPPNGTCTSARECSYGGECVSGRCVCDATWTGPTCERLHLLPARRGSGYPSLPATGALPTTSTFTWGGAVVADTNASGVVSYHGFFTECVRERERERERENHSELHA
jgi:hypothetical protein